MAVSALCPLSLQTLFDTQGLPIVPARLYFFNANTVTPMAVYKDALLSVAHQHPVLTGGTGRVPPIYVGVAPYRVRIFDQHGQLIEDIDGITGAVDTSGGGGGGGGTINPGDARLIATGDMILSFSNALRTGFVRANGNTIGKVAGSERGDPDCQALFQWLWDQDFDHMLPVIGGRGTTSLGDWNAPKQITLPDYRARGVVGADGMGGLATNRMALATMDDAGTPAMMGGHGGRDRQTLDLTQIAAHTHAASGYSDSIGAHVHNGLTGYETVGHTHSVPSGGASSTTGPGAVSTFATMSGTQTGGESAAHQHYFSTNNDGTGQHQHILTVTNTTVGGGQAHQQVPPFMTAMVYIKL